jgi:uncharacterized membrane protein
MMKRIRQYFLTGLVVLLPAVATVYVFWLLFHKIDGILGPSIHKYTGHHLYGVGFVAVILIVFLLGVLASNYIGRRLFRAGDIAFMHLPMVNRLYDAAKQISEVVFSQKATVFRRVVLVEFPQAGSYSIAFVTAEADNSLDVAGGAEAGPYLHVFVPTPPNPTAGFLLIVPENRTIPLDMPMDDALKFVLSGGALVPPTHTRKGRRREESAVS